VTYYRADSSDPWEYSWVEFNGTGVSKFLSSTAFSKNSPVIYKNFASEKPILKLIETDSLNPYALYGALMEFLASFALSAPKPDSTADEYVKYALNYIHTLHFNNNMTINEISDYVGINRSYFCRIFKEKMGVSPKQYMTEFKMKTAKHLLEETNLTIGEISRSAGYEDPLYFSTTFKSFYGHSPSEHRKLM
jgi:AraC family transcriptional regulator of arabinose operon